MLRLAALVCLSLPALSMGREMWGRAMGANCTVRAEQRECLTNPLFMEKDCKRECSVIIPTLVDLNPRFCQRATHLCFALPGGDKREQFVFHDCNKTCHHHFQNIERILAPSDIQALIHGLLPIVYTVSLVVLLGYQLLVKSSSFIMLRMEQLKNSPGWLAAMAERVQGWLVFLCDNQESNPIRPHAVGRLFVCGYYIMEGGFLFGWSAVGAYVLPKIGGHPKLLNSCQTLLVFYSSLEAVFTLIKVLILSTVKLNNPDHHPIKYDAELMCKKLAMLGVAMLFIQSSSMMPAKKVKKSVLPGMGDEEERTGLDEALLLMGRLLMAALFCFVGFAESKRVLFGELSDPPDGHDYLWPKVIQLLLVLPFTLGYKTRAVTTMLAVSLVLESMTIWMFWRELFSDMPTLFHAIHSKDHFATNVAVAGGLFLLQEEDGGKYTLDAYLKKKD